MRETEREKDSLEDRRETERDQDSLRELARDFTSLRPFASSIRRETGRYKERYYTRLTLPETREGLARPRPSRGRGRQQETGEILFNNSISVVDERSYKKTLNVRQQ